MDDISSSQQKKLLFKRKGYTRWVDAVSFLRFQFLFVYLFILTHCVVRCSCARLSYACTNSPGLPSTISFNPRLILTNFKCMILAVISNNERESNPDLCDAGEVLNQLNSQSQLRTGGLWVDCNSVGDGLLYIYIHEIHVFWTLQSKC